MRPTVLFHVQHFLGMGHLVRAFALADALTTQFRVVVVSGGRFPPGIDPPSGIELECLPALSFDAERNLTTEQPGYTVDRVLAERTKRLLEIYDETRPAIVLIELFPFGRKKLAGELVALLERARNSASPPFIATSVRDLLVTGRHDQQRHDDRAADLADRYLDLVLVHSDRRFARLAHSFRPTLPLTVPAIYTGFVGGRPSSDSAPREIQPGTVVVSAGGGWVGGALMAAALDAAPIMATRHGVTTTLITGPLAGDDERRSLDLRASALPMVQVVRSVPGLLSTLRAAAASISQAGYNTAVDLLRAKVPAVLVPFGDERENEQPRRAAALARHGLARVVDPDQVTGRVLADEVDSVIGRPLPSVPWSIDGAARTATVLHEALGAERRRSG